MFMCYECLVSAKKMLSIKDPKFGWETFPWTEVAMHDETY